MTREWTRKMQMLDTFDTGLNTVESVNEQNKTGHSC